MDEFQKQMYDVFAFETNTFLSQIETLLMQADEADGNLLPAVPEIFRAMHTLKSSSAMMGFENISKLAHTTEDLFHFIRDERPSEINTKELTDLVLQCTDYIKRNMIPDSNEDPSLIIEQISQCLQSLKGDTSAPHGPSAIPDQPPAASIELEKLQAVFVPKCQTIGLRAFEIATKISRLEPAAQFSPKDDSLDGEQILQTKGLEILLPRSSDIAKIKQLISTSPFIQEVFTVAQDTKDPASTFVERRQDVSRRASNLVSVQIQQLDDLVNLTGEMLIASMGIEHIAASGDAELLSQNLQAMHNLILGLQDVALSLRMVSLKDLFHQLHRLVRSAAGQLSRNIRFQMSGEDTAMDKKIIESMVSPLQHLLRNAVDHGIESPQERIALGKNPDGLITISANVESGFATLTVSDDGRGLARDAIAEKAIAMDLVSKEQAAVMTDEAICQLILIPGFSTRDEVTELSGRGVGLDVVNSAVARLNGSIRIQSQAGQGTTFIVQLPLTLTVLKVLLVKAGETTAAIPLMSVVEAFKAEETAIRSVGGVDTVLFNEKPYPILSLEAKFSAESTPYDQGIMLIMSGGIEQYALYVTEVMESKDMVVKPVPPLFSHIKDIYGMTILGDGTVSPIMDATGLYQSFKGVKKRG